jgi:hypothetical protein
MHHAHIGGMMRSFRNLIERQIKKAEAEGQLTGLEGEGKPLPKRHDTEDPATAVGHSIMARAGVLPREFKLKEQLEAAKRDWQQATDPDEKNASWRRSPNWNLTTMSSARHTASF